MDRSLDGSASRAHLDRVDRWASALGCWFVAGCFLVSWWWPRLLDDGRWVRFGVGVLLFEFLTIHASGLFMGLRQKGPSLRGALGLVALYAVFGVTMALAFGSWVLLLSFALLLFFRVRALFHPEDPAAAAASMRRVAVSALLFLALAFATVFVPMPPGGLDGPLLDEVWPGRGGGIWERRPQQALAMGFVYFLVLGWVESRPPAARWHQRGPRVSSS